MVLEGDGVISEFSGGYDDWLNQRKVISQSKARISGVRSEESAPAEKSKSKKLSYHEEKELAELTAKIGKMEALRDEMYAVMSDPAFIKNSPLEINHAKAKLEAIEDTLLKDFERWATLEDLRLN